MATRIITKNGSGAPLASDLQQGELAVDLTNKRLYTENASGTVLELGTSPSTIDINAGTIDGTVIGGTTPAAVTTTALVATTADINAGTIDGTVIGGSSAAAGSFTTLTASGDVTLSGGTANGVAFANGSKVLTTGSALTFDGTVLTLGANGSFINAFSGNGLVVSKTNVGSANAIRSVSDTSDILLINDSASGFANTAFYASGSEQMRLNSTGLGIGTSSPARALHVVGTGRPAEFGSDNVINYVKLYNSATGNGTYNGLDFLVNSTSNSQINAYGMPLTFGTSASNGTDVTERLRITSTGACEWRPNGTTQAMTLDASGNLLVGKTSAALAGAGTAILATGTHNVTVNGDTTLQLNRLTSDGAIATFYKDGTTVGSIGANGGDVYIGTGDTTIRFADSDDAIIPRGTDGAVRDGAINLGISNNRFKDLYLSGGVYLGGTGAANLLDDYEEGTWTPALQRVGAGNSLTYTSQTGYYTKVGRKVSVNGRIEINAVTSQGSSVSYINGLPFAIGGLASITFAGSVGANTGLATVVTSVCMGRGTETTITFRDHANTTQNLAANYVASGVIVFSLEYFID